MYLYIWRLTGSKTRVAVLNTITRGGLTPMMVFEQKPEGSKISRYLGIKGIAGKIA